ncbi:MAG: hypothetical protein Kow0042_04320 [Calditrichia bacterium]
MIREMVEFKKKFPFTFFPAIGLGFFSLSIQVVFIRVLLEIFQGNELTIGFALGIWLMGTALGSTWVALLLKKVRLFKQIPLLTILFTLIEYLLIKFAPVIFPLVMGTLPPLHLTVFIFLVSIMPVALIIGAVFPYLVEEVLSLADETTRRRIIYIYLWESVGAFLGGLVLNFVLFRFLNSLQIIWISLLVFWVSIPFFLLRKRRSPGKRIAALFLLGILTIGIGLKATTIEAAIYELLYRPYRLLKAEDSPYGNIKITRLEDQTTIINQGKVYYIIPDPYSAETHVLIPLLLHPAPEKLLIVGGNLAEYLPYLEKIDHLKTILYLEIDPILVDFQREKLSGKKLRPGLSVGFRTDDIRRYLTRTGDYFDVIVLNQPEPHTLNLNRLYTREFFTLLRTHLNPGGLIFFSIRSSENYINPELGRYINLLKNTLEESFAYSVILPGDENFILASDKRYFEEIPAKLIENYKRYGIEPVYLSPVYLNFRLSSERFQFFHQQLEANHHPHINTDLNLKGYLYHFQVWNRLYGEGLQKYFNFFQRHKTHFIILFFLLFLLVKFFFRQNPRIGVLIDLFGVGATSLALELILLLEYQILYGSIYSHMAVIFALYMLGLAVGTRVWYKREEVKNQSQAFIPPIGGLALCALVLMGFAFFEFHLLSAPILFKLIQWLWETILIFGIGFFTGKYFALVTGVYFAKSEGKQTGITYGVDLAGAVCGAFFTSVLIVPIYGISGGLLLIILFLFMLLGWRIFFR